MVNTDGIVTATFPTPGGRPRYDGDTAIDGVPGTAAAVVLDFEDSGAGASVFPTGNVTDIFGGITVTCVDNGMPVVVAAAASFGKTGQESVAELEGDAELNRRVQELRLAAGKAMGLGDVSATTVPKISLVAPPAHGGTIGTRTFIPVRVHQSIGVLGAVSVGTAIMVPGAVGHDLAVLAAGSPRLAIEHPSGALEVEVELDARHDAADGDPLGRGPHRPQALRRHRLSPVARTARGCPGRWDVAWGVGPGTVRSDGCDLDLGRRRPGYSSSAGVEMRLKTAPSASATTAIRP